MKTIKELAQINEAIFQQQLIRDKAICKEDREAIEAAEKEIARLDSLRR